MMKTTRSVKLCAATIAASALALSSCGDSGEEDRTVSIGYVAWDEVTAATYLWQHILEEEGYSVELTQLEPAAVYAAVAQNDVDFFLAAIPETQGDYWDQFGDGFESVAEWYEPLRHGLTVPDYVDAESIEDLEGSADEYGGRIVGIEPGSGLMGETNTAYETYDLDGYDLIEGSSAAMLAEFERAINAEEEIVVTAWNPHWAVEEYDMKFLEDPEGIFVDGGVYHVIASEDAQDEDELLAYFEDFSMEDGDLMPLLSELRSAGSGNEADAVDAWLETQENADLVDSWVGSD